MGEGHKAGKKLDKISLQKLLLSEHFTSYKLNFKTMTLRSDKTCLIVHLFSSSATLFFEIMYICSEGRRPIGRPWHRWEDNIKMDIRGVGWEGAWSGTIWLRIGTGDGLF
jgi:hypothetical protein